MKRLKQKFFLFLILGLAIIAVFSYWSYRRQIFSKEVMKIEILGPSSAEAGEEVEYNLVYKNQGAVRLEGLVLYFDFPENSLVEDNGAGRITKELEDIYPGQEEILKFKGRIFGKENEVKVARAIINYRPKNLKAVYESKSSFSTKIESASITFKFDFPSKITVGQETKISLNYFSNLNHPLNDLRIQADYPGGFEFLRSEPRGIENNEWEVGLLNKAEGGRIDIYGRITGEAGEVRIFNAELGVWTNDNFILLKEISRGVEIIKPKLSLFQTINGQSDYLARAGEGLHYELYFRNTGEEEFEDLFLVVELEGPVDFETLNLEKGRINQVEHSILWDQRELERLTLLRPGEEGKVEFWVDLKEDLGVSKPEDKNLSVKNKVKLSQINQVFETKIASQIELTQDGYFENEVWQNSGPIPPKVSEKTTYVIIWQAKNYYNGLENAKVKAVLPESVNLTGKIFPEEEKSSFSFDSVSREIVWDLGALPAHTGTLYPAKSIAFQIGLVPRQEQRGGTVELISQAVFSASDQWAETELSVSSAGFDTTLPADETIKPEDGVVQ